MKNLKQKRLWHSLDQLKQTQKFKEFVENEFPPLPDNSHLVSRRKFISLMGASFALAGLVSCRRPIEKIIPYVKPPENSILGQPNYFATTMPFANTAQGLLIKTNEGRPTKVEGNDLHPANLGATNIFSQASVLNLYDPDRAKSVTLEGKKKSRQDFVDDWQNQYKLLGDKKGRGVAVLSTAFSSPTLARLADKFKNTFPQAEWYVYEPINNENVFQGIKTATGEQFFPVYHFDKAKVILSLDFDFLYSDPDSVFYTQQFSSGREAGHSLEDMNRLYCVESVFSVTGANADHRLCLTSQYMLPFLQSLITELNALGLKINIDDAEIGSDIELNKEWIKAVARDLYLNKGTSLIVAGPNQPSVVHALVLLINKHLSNINNTVKYRQPVDSYRSDTSGLYRLQNQIQNNEIDTLIILGGNPVYNTPGDIDFASLFKNVDYTVHLSESFNETSERVKWHIPETHYMESWGDAYSLQGIAGIIQPLIQPLFDAHSNVELLNLLSSGEDVKGYDLVRDTWVKILPKGNFEYQWQKLLHDGYYSNTVDYKTDFKINEKNISKNVVKTLQSIKPVSKENPELICLASGNVYDGRFSNNGWLQELPDPISKLSWDNALYMNQKTADALSVKNEDLVKIQLDDKTVTAPVWIVPGYADFTLAIAHGYGRTKCGDVGNNVGTNIYPLQRQNAMNVIRGIRIEKTGKKYSLASTQDHGSMEGRPLALEASLQEFLKHPEFVHEHSEHPPLKNLGFEHKYDKGYQWGMTIDLNRCIGCNACTIACQSENNIPIVGKKQVKNGREMHWIRLDRYFTGEPDNPGIIHQPVACHHCENAPCEQVCPVAATIHDKEGLNLMTYNRCVGTRYCSNNCPYKVRRFNFFNYTSDMPEIFKMTQNPDVTVRSRGVMEKCTYCVQRINEAKLKAKKQGTTVKDGELKTACQQACPAQAIQFGNILEENSTVVNLKQNHRAYEMLAELNIRPRTSYLARIKNINPEIEKLEI